MLQQHFSAIFILSSFGSGSGEDEIIFIIKMEGIHSRNYNKDILPCVNDKAQCSVWLILQLWDVFLADNEHILSLNINSVAWCYSIMNFLIKYASILCGDYFL